jgi:hypothetical protein
MGEKKQIHIRIDERDKERWEQYAEEHEDIYDGSLTSLIKRAVRHEISDSWVLESEQEGSAEVDLDPIQDDLSELKEDVGRIQNTLDQLERSSSGEAKELSRDETLDLATQLHDMIPEVPRGEEPPPMDPDGVEDNESTGLPEELADELDLPEHHVRKALIELQSSLSNIKTRKEGDKRQWYEETP